MKNIPKLRNGEHRVLQRQIDLNYRELVYIRKNIMQGVEANTQSKTNFKLICILIAGLFTLTGAIVIQVI